LSLAIGREGQNVRLAARLTGWRLDITSEADAEEARARYLVEREERLSPEETSEDAATETQEPGEGEEGAPAIDPELIRKLEEFKRQMFDPSHRAAEDTEAGSSE
jgi:N utilization substance protein A